MTTRPLFSANPAPNRSPFQQGILSNPSPKTFSDDVRAGSKERPFDIIAHELSFALQKLSQEGIHGCVIQRWIGNIFITVTAAKTAQGFQTYWMLGIPSSDELMFTTDDPLEAIAALGTLLS